MENDAYLISIWYKKEMFSSSFHSASSPWAGTSPTRSFPCPPWLFVRRGRFYFIFSYNNNRTQPACRARRLDFWLWFTSIHVSLFILLLKLCDLIRRSRCLFYVFLHLRGNCLFCFERLFLAQFSLSMMGGFWGRALFGFMVNDPDAIWLPWYQFNYRGFVQWAEVWDWFFGCLRKWNIGRIRFKIISETYL